MFNDILFESQKFSFKKIHLKMQSAKMAAILSQPQFVKQYIAESKRKRQLRVTGAELGAVSSSQNIARKRPNKINFWKTNIKMKTGAETRLI